jgi:hypothetical protein
MTKTEIIQRLVDNHNRIAQVTVSGNNTFLIGDTIRDLRDLVAQLSKDVEAEAEENSENGSDGIMLGE